MKPIHRSRLEDPWIKVAMMLCTDKLNVLLVSELDTVGVSLT